MFPNGNTADSDRGVVRSRNDNPDNRLCFLAGSSLSLGIGFATLNGMLAIGRTTLPRTPLAYIAFRVAMLDTAERMALSQQMGTADLRAFGYLTEVPYLKRCAPQVQIDVLLKTWAKHIDSERHVADLLDEAVIYAACEASAYLIEREPHVVSRLLDGGPLAHHPPLTESLVERIRKLHIGLDSDGDFLLLSQFEDMAPGEADTLKSKFGIDPAQAEILAAPLDEWRMDASWPARTSGLLDPSEKTRVAVQIGGYLAAAAPGALAASEANNRDEETDEFGVG